MYDKLFIPMRCQPPHIGHVSLIKSACEKAKEVVVLLCNTSEINAKNPFYGSERELMLRESLKAYDNFSILHMPSFPDKKDWYDFVFEYGRLKKDTVIVSGNPFILKEFTKLGYKVITPQDIIGEDLIDIDASRLRFKIINNEDYEEFLAIGTKKYFEKFNIKKRLTELK